MAWGSKRRIALAFGAALPACNEPDPAHDDAVRLMAQLCESAERCACAGDLAEGDCVDHRVAVWDERIAEGRRRNLTYDRECFETQVALAGEYGCWGAGNFDQHLCESFCAVFHGNRAEGESCEGFDEVVSNCAQGLLCADDTCVSPCARLTGLTAGEPCMSVEGETIEDCAVGLQCDYNTRTCIALPELGQPCSGSCAFGAFCDWQTSTCAPLRGEGENCMNAECAPELYCQYFWDEATATESYTCLRYALEGESCGDYVYCGSGLGCGPDFRCRGPGDVGESCSAGCRDGLYCEFSIDQCLAAPDEAGLPCPNGTCAAGLWCDTALPPGVCQAKIATGERCSGHSQCESSYCPAAFCLERPALGDDCTAAGVCQYGLVCDGTACIEAAEAGPAACSYQGW